MWFDNKTWQPELLIESRPQPQKDEEEPVEPDYVPHEPQRATTDHEWDYYDYLYQEIGGSE